MSKKDPFQIVPRKTDRMAWDEAYPPTESEALKALAYVRRVWWISGTVVVGGLVWGVSFLPVIVWVIALQVLGVLAGLAGVVVIGVWVDSACRAYKKRLDIVKRAKREGVIEDE